MLPEYRTVLYATDLGRHAPRVLRHALGLARRFGGSLVVLHVVEELGPAARQMVELYAHEEAAARGGERRAHELRQALEARLSALCAGETACGGECAARLLVLAGRPEEVILREARALGADVIVMGSHGHTAVGEMLLGSTAHRVMQKSPVPVLLVRVDEADTGNGV